VDHILEALQEVLDDMEHVLKVLHEAEQQKNADEQEIESLRQKLNKLQRGRGE
jgi:SUMO ligase MMS21 Smc5/6 complex component